MRISTDVETSRCCSTGSLLGYSRSYLRPDSNPRNGPVCSWGLKTAAQSCVGNIMTWHPQILATVVKCCYLTAKRSHACIPAIWTWDKHVCMVGFLWALWLSPPVQKQKPWGRLETTQRTNTKRCPHSRGSLSCHCVICWALICLSMWFVYVKHLKKTLLWTGTGRPHWAQSWWKDGWLQPGLITCLLCGETWANTHRFEDILNIIMSVRLTSWHEQCRLVTVSHLGSNASQMWLLMTSLLSSLGFATGGLSLSLYPLEGRGGVSSSSAPLF